MEVTNVSSVRTCEYALKEINKIDKEKRLFIFVEYWFTFFRI